MIRFGASGACLNTFERPPISSCRLTPIRRRAKGKLFVGGLDVETESIARCSAIMCRCENLILLLNRIELEVLLKFLEKIVK